MIPVFVAFSLVLSTISLGDEIEFSRPSLELYEEFLLTRHLPHYIFKFEDLRERARSLSVDELYEIRDDVDAIFTLGFTDESTSINRRYLATELLSRALATGLFEKEYETLLEIYEKFRQDLLVRASLPADTHAKRAYISAISSFYRMLLFEMIHNLSAISVEFQKVHKFIITNTDFPVVWVRTVALDGLRDLIREKGASAVNKEDILTALNTVKIRENQVQEMDANAFREWPLRGLESQGQSRANLMIILQIEELLEQ